MGSPSKRKWSIRTSYTGVAGIHSEVQTGTTARNNVTNKRTSDNITTEEVLHPKHMQSLSFNKRSLERSMLAYSQKMKCITEHKTKMLEKNDPQSRPGTVSSSGSPQNLQASAKSSKFLRNSAVSPINCVNDEGPIRKIDMLASKKFLPYKSSSGDALGRISIDSGISIDTKSECSDVFSDAYHSDTDSHGKWSSASSVFECGPDKEGSPLESSRSNNGKTMERAARRRRLGRRRLGVDDKPELPPVADIILELQGTENEGSSSDIDSPHSNTEERLSIASFPPCGNDSLTPLSECDQHDNESDGGRNRSTISNPLSGNSWFLKPVSPRRQPAKYETKPKAIRSPSVTSLRVRQPKPRPSKPFHKIFRYSDMIESDVLIQNQNVIDGDTVTVKPIRLSTPNVKPGWIGTTDLRRAQSLKSININESPEPLPGPSPPLPAERCMSAPLPTVEANDTEGTNNLKSVLRKGSPRVFERKTVKFALPVRNKLTKQDKGRSES